MMIYRGYEVNAIDTRDTQKLKTVNSIYHLFFDAQIDSKST